MPQRNALGHMMSGSTEHLATTCTRPKTPADGSPKKQKGAKVEGEDQSPKASGKTPKRGADPALKDLLGEASKMLKSLSSSSSTTSTKEEKPESPGAGGAAAAASVASAVRELTLKK